MTGAQRVYPVHYDDFAKPFGEISLFPRIADDVVRTADWINDIAIASEVEVDIQRLPFGQRIVLY